ncbi:hypothetical protein K437DRAFT_121949 [Tilletiaria anomala UBC 951]|uniref:Uncharacterized protein n=1 Tax=Tilletiaria anomala (strain ATCC 24038 / CBS 436.72 / UBC 951) TaxID=1037660 RepID=A0A066VYV8_TILAU|nr:uncharacterized protein K437DRAFT_121949 [Tilletiaria anomala UBC 951]KDN45463.1 hypothetical protein K437DRAFT_121949 [Tilletiaria anomala UBC 951]
MSTTESSTSTTKSSSVKTSTSTSSKPTSVLSSSSTLPLATFTQPKILTSTVSTVGTPSSTLAANSASSKSNSPGAGPIIGIVAAALVGVAILSALIGFIWKKCVRRDDPYEANPFDKDDFRRHSAMLPDTFDNDDGAPSMSEHHNFSPNMYEGAGMAGMGIIAAGAGVAAASDRMAHNEIGAPRPPTMFQRHINGPAAQFDSNAAYSQAPNVPPVPSMGAYGPAYPQLPPMAFGGAAEAFVAGGVPPMANVANPYAHLDRGMHDASSGLGRSGSNVSGSGGSGGYGSAQEDYMDTAGRPGTSESRSGTPDLPNVQQTYAALDQHNRFPKFNSPPSEPVRNPFGDGGNDSHNAAQQHDSMDSTNMLQHYYTGSKGSASGAGADAGRNASPMTMMQNHNAATAVSSFPANLQSQPSLSVRNFMPSQAASNTRPISTVSTQADPDDAYGGVW